MTLARRQRRERLWIAQRGLCAICGASMSRADATIDHIIPRSRGGSDKLRNLRAAHRACNTARGSDVGDVFVRIAGLVALRWNVREADCG